MSARLKSCPFCGGMAITYHSGGYGWTVVRCFKCGIQTISHIRDERQRIEANAVEQQSAEDARSAAPQKEQPRQAIQDTM